MESEQVPAHGGIGKAELNVALHAPEQSHVVVAEQVRGHDHHALEAVEFLHQDVSVLVDRGRARFIEADPLGEKAVGLVEKEDRPVMGRPLEGPLDVLGRVAQILRDHRDVIDLVERLAELQGHAQGGARFPGAGWVIEVDVVVEKTN